MGQKASKNHSKPSLWRLSGRRVRLSYLGWSFLIGLVAVLIAFSLDALFFLLIGGRALDFAVLIGEDPSIFFKLLLVPSYWLQICVSAQRCQDIGWHKKWAFLHLPYYVTYTFGISQIAATIFSIVGLILWLILIFKAGDKSNNRYGPPPAKLRKAE